VSERGKKDEEENFGGKVLSSQKPTVSHGKPLKHKSLVKMGRIHGGNPYGISLGLVL